MPFAWRLVVLVACAWLAPALAQTSGPVTTTVTVKGSVQQEITLWVDDLKRLPIQPVEDMRTVRDAGAGASSSETVRHYVGCLLRDVLERAKPVEKKRM